MRLCRLCRLCSGCNARNERNFPCWLGSSSRTAILLIAALPNPVMLCKKSINKMRPSGRCKSKTAVLAVLSSSIAFVNFMTFSHCRKFASQAALPSQSAFSFSVSFDRPLGLAHRAAHPRLPWPVHLPVPVVLDLVQPRCRSDKSRLW